MEAFAAFLGISALVIVTPGPDTALTIRNSLTGGRRAGVWTALGVASGQACWTVAASVGVAALLVASEPAFLALKYAGAAYLVYLGIRTLAGARPHGEAARERPRGLGASAAYRQGIVSNLANPKMAVFFTSLLPQFAGGAVFAGSLLFGLTFCAMTFAWLSAYALAVTRASQLLARVRRVLDAVTGTVLIALGLRVASTPR